MENRDTYKYHLMKGHTIVYRGITDDLQRREAEHQQTWETAKIRQVGRRTSREAALKWERAGSRRGYKR